MAASLLLTLVAASASFAQAESASDRREFDNAWAKYVELFKTGDYDASLIEAERGYELGEKLLHESDETLASVTYAYGNNLLKAGNVEMSACYQLKRI